MNIIVTITVGLNVLQNASKCAISKEKIPIFLERGHSPLPRPHPMHWGGGYPLPDPTLVEPPPNHISGYGPADYIVSGESERAHCTNERLSDKKC